MITEIPANIFKVAEKVRRNQRKITALALLAFGLLWLQQERPVQHHSYPYVTEIITGSFTLTSETTTIPFPLITRVARFADITQFDMEMSLRESNDGYEATSLAALEWLRASNDAIFVMNGSFFDPVKYNVRDRMLNLSDGINIHGQVIADDKQISSPEFGYAVICFDSSDHPTIEKFQCPLDTKTAIAGRTILVEDGKVNQNLRDTMRHPRMAIGFNGDEMIIVGIEGRQDSSLGFTLPELAQKLNSLGATDAIELDGGGSLSMGYTNEQREVVALNAFTDKYGLFRLPRPVFAVRFIEKSTIRP